MFDQANPDTPNDVIIAEVAAAEAGSRRPELPVDDELPVRQDPRARAPRGRARRQARLRRRLRDAQRRARQAPGAPRSTSSAAATASSSSSISSSTSTIPAGVARRDLAGRRRRRPRRTRPACSTATSTSGRSRTARASPLDFVESMPLDVPAVLSLERFTTMQTSRGCPWPCVFCDIPIFNEGKWRSRSPEHVLAEFKQLQKDGYGAVYFVDDHFLLQPKRIEAICKGINDARHHDPVGLRGTRRLRRAWISSRPWRRRTAARSCSASRAAARRSSTA